jgi:predicted small lipoprotein YifL
MRKFLIITAVAGVMFALAGCGLEQRLFDALA